MKSWILIGLMAVTALPAQAQLFSSEALGGAALGGLAGGIIGHNNGRKTAEGAAIGAGAGLLLGSVVHNERERRQYYSAPAAVVEAPAYYAPPSRPNYAVSGAVLGGVAGGVIGHNSGRKTAEGVAIGAGAGLLLGSVAEQNARRRERSVIYAPPPAVVYAPAPAPAPAAPPTPPAPVTVINNYNYYGTPGPMSQANSLFGR